MGRAAPRRSHRGGSRPRQPGGAPVGRGAREAAACGRLRRRQVPRRPGRAARAGCRGVAPVNPAPLVDILAQVGTAQRRWLVTGTAGFIGSHLLETLLRAGQDVRTLDNFSTGRRSNLEQVRERVGEHAWARHHLIDGDIADEATCRDACAGIDIVLPQAALGSVPRSIADPLNTHRSNATGFLNMLVAAQAAGVSRYVYAASSSTYGDS